MKTPPITWTWDNGVLMPATSAMARLADQHMSDGERYTLVEHEERSSPAHRHYFACIREAWLNLPEHLVDRFPSPEALRKYALIKAGYCDSQTFVASSKAEAGRLAAFLRPIDEYAVVAVEGCTVAHYTARSQSMKAMDKAAFQQSKDDVLQVLSDMLGTDVAELNQTEAA